MKTYVVKEDEGKIKVILKSLTTADRIGHILGYTILAFPFALFSIINLMVENYVVGFLFPLGCVLVFLLAVRGFKWQKKREKAFCFYLTSEGIHLCDLDGSFFVSWSRIVSFGLVNHNCMTRGRVRSYQCCMYFSVEKYDERFLRKRMLLRCNNTGSNEKMIIFPFGIDFAEGEYKAFCEYIYRYCDKQKEQNFIEIVV